MKFGMPALIEFNNLEQNIQLCRKLGLDFIELNMNLPIFTPEHLSSRELRDWSEQYDLEFTIHLPEELDLSSFHPAIRRGHIERCQQTLDWAMEAGVKVFNMHVNNGIYFTLPDRKVWINEQYEAEFMDLLLDSYSQIFTGVESIQLCVENTGNFQLPFINQALDQLLREADLYLTWDVGHDGKAQFQEERFFIDRLNRIRHMHLHDYNGISDHQPLYTGIVPINERLELAQEYDWSVVIEVKTSAALEESVKALRANFYRHM